MSSSESDQFGGDDEDADPDYEINLNPQRNRFLRISHSSDTSPDQEEKKKTRKRKRNPESWRRNEIKRLRNSGAAYKDWNGKQRPEKKIKATCTNCRLKCSEKINEEHRNSIFKAFWDFRDINRQRDYISKYVHCSKKARNRKRQVQNEDNEHDGNSRRSLTFTYYLPVETSKTQVCKTFF